MKYAIALTAGKGGPLSGIQDIVRRASGLWGWLAEEADGDLV